MNTETLNKTEYKTLAADWMQAKRKEQEWNEKRLAIEAQLLDLLPALPEEGEKSMRQDGFLTVAKAGLHIKPVSKEAFLAGIEAGIVPPTIIETVLYETGFKRLRRMAQDQDPQALATYSALSSLFVVTPAKVNIVVSKVA